MRLQNIELASQLKNWIEISIQCKNNILLRIHLYTFGFHFLIYEVECQLCPVGARSLYIGESSRNLYTRSKEHEANYRAGRITSFMVKHQIKHTGGRNLTTRPKSLPPPDRSGRLC